MPTYGNFSAKKGCVMKPQKSSVFAPFYKCKQNKSEKIQKKFFKMKTEIRVTAKGEFVVQEMKARVGNFMMKGQFLFSLKDKSSGNVTKIRAEADGKPSKILHKSGSDVTHG